MAIDQEQIIRLFKAKEKQTEIARLTGVRKSYIHLVLRNHGLIPFPPSRLDKNTIEKVSELYESGKSIQFIIDELNVTRYDVTVVLKKKFRHHSESNHLNGVNNAPEVDESLKQLILGSLLGDASISRNENRGYHVRITHSEKQRGYSEYLASRLNVKLHEYEGKPGGFSKQAFKYYVLWYKNAKFSKYLESIVLDNGKKKISQKWLDELKLEGIAYWFMDDGSSTWVDNSLEIHFSTLGFGVEENKLLAEKLTLMGYKTRINLDRRVSNGPGMFLRMSRFTTKKFMEDIKPYVWPIECMRYKLKLGVLTLIKGENGKSDRTKFCKS